MPGPHPDADDPLGLAAWGIEAGYHDVHGTWRAVEPDTARALRRAMGAGAVPGDAPPPGTTRVVHAGRAPDLGGPGTIVLEDGSEVTVTAAAPPDLPLGYHRWHPAGAPSDRGAHLIVAPNRCPVPDGLRTWGPTVQLYAARSRRSWGIGDLADLAAIARWTRERDGGVVGLNPLHAHAPAAHPIDSPYTPSSRRWWNPLYLAIEDVPGATRLPDLAERAAQARALDAGSRIDRAAVWSHKRDALEVIWANVGGRPDPGFAAFRAEHGSDLDRWATFCVLADRHGPDWRTWPAELRRPDGPAARRVLAEEPDAVAFWAWLQWLLDAQLTASGADELAIADLAVGIDPGGADAWDWQDLLATEVSVGAPPDLLGPDGQDWGLPPFVPWRLAAAGYQPLARTLRACLRHARALRIDHVMGLFRLFWIPPGRTAAHGAYVRSPGRELLDIVALEATRAGAIVIGEDLGTVGHGVRELLAEARVLSTRLLWFEDRPPAQWPELAMAAVTTHDLPTIAGVWTGTDLADQEAAGVTVAYEGDAEFRHRLRVAASVDDAADVDTVIVAAHRHLATAPSAIVTASLDDLVGADHRPNVPGTIDEHPNWRIPLPVLVDDLHGHPVAEAVAAALADR